MRGRIGTLNPLTFLAALAVLTLAPAPAHAHRLVIECRILPDRKVQVEGWYNSPANLHPAAQAKVVVRRNDGSTLVEGELDSRGYFTFAPEQAEALTVIVSQTGHREELIIPGEKLAAAPERAPSPTDPPAAPMTVTPVHPVREELKELLIGVGFVLALAAFVLSLRNARALKRLGGKER
jgi:hypothetical protein